MRYVIIQDLKDPTYQVYGIMTDDFGQLIRVVDMNCNPCDLPVEHSIIDRFPTPPPCA
jgi:hypothetical protein